MAEGDQVSLPAKILFRLSRIVAVSPEQRSNVGCNIELTKIRINANEADWLTVGFEAYGPSGRVIAILDEAIEHFFTLHGNAPVLLNSRDSISYPIWLTCSVIDCNSTECTHSEKDP